MVVIAWRVWKMEYGKRPREYGKSLQLPGTPASTQTIWEPPILHWFPDDRHVPCGGLSAQCKTKCIVLGKVHTTTFCGHWMGPCRRSVIDVHRFEKAYDNALILAMAMTSANHWKKKFPKEKKQRRFQSKRMWENPERHRERERERKSRRYGEQHRNAQMHG